MNGSASNSMMNNNAANAGRTNFTNKQLTVGRKLKNTKNEMIFYFRN